MQSLSTPRSVKRSRLDKLAGRVSRILGFSSQNGLAARLRRPSGTKAKDSGLIFQDPTDEHLRPRRRGEGGLPLQVGALPWRSRGTELEVLLVQSLSTRRWIVPKGWPLREAELWEAAQQEAFEEAGVIGDVGHLPLGKFKHEKTV
jgi:hypothetical protein